MRYYLNINQEAVIRHGLDLDFEDCAILGFVTQFMVATDAVKQVDTDGNLWVWIRWKLVGDQLPMLRKRQGDGSFAPWSSDSIYNRMRSLEERGYIRIEYDDQARRSWVSVTAKGLLLTSPPDQPYADRDRDQAGDQPRTCIRPTSDVHPTHLGRASEVILEEYKSINQKTEKGACTSHVRDAGAHARLEPPETVTFDKVTGTIKGWGIEVSVNDILDLAKDNSPVISPFPALPDFDWWWKAYGYDGDRMKAEVEFYPLAYEPEKWALVVYHTVLSRIAQPNKRYRAKPYKYLKDKTYLNGEIVDYRDEGRHKGGIDISSDNLGNVNPWS